MDLTISFILGQQQCAKIPDWMKEGRRIVGGQEAPAPIPWQASF